MEADINVLALFALNLEEAKNRFAPEVVATFAEILVFAEGRASELLVLHKDVQLMAAALTDELKLQYPILSAAAIESVIIYVHFYTCR